MSQPDTRQRLLDAAEHLFAMEGFHSTSLRVLTGAAKANLAAVKYHFGSKEALLEAVVERRLVPLNQVRQARLKSVRTAARLAGKRPETAEVLRAIVEPTLAFRDSGAGADAFIRLVARAIAEPDDIIRKIFMKLMEPLFFLWYETLGEALPELSPTELFWRLHFAIGTLGHAICMAGHFHVLPAGVAPRPDAATLTAMMLNFLTAGMEAPCA
jgi:AcrR family transcriptional regulator